MAETAWSRGVYEDGWNARQILCHFASTSGVAGFLLGMGQMASPPNLGGGFDENAFNAQQVAARQDKSPADLVGEIQRNFERDVQAIRNASDDLLKKHFKAPWDVEGELGDVIVESLNGHLGMHLADLRSAAH